MQAREPLEYQTFQEAQKSFNFAERWKVFDGNREKFNIAYECIDRHPKDKEAIRLKFDDGRQKIYTFGELSSLSSQFANMLARRRIKAQDAVAIILNPSIEFYTGFFGTLKRGAIVVPCSALFGPEAIELRLRDSQAKMAITTCEKIDLIDKGLVKDILMAEELLDLLKKENDHHEATTSAESLAVIQFSSGTTGRPKPVPYRHIAATLTAVNMKLGVGLKNDDRYFCPSFPAWGHGIWYGTVGPLIFGNAIGTYSGKFNTEVLLEALEEFRITNLFVTPLVLRSMVNKMERYQLHLRDLSYTGGPLDLDTLIKYRDILGISPRSIYGSTEVGVILLHYPFKDYQIKLGSIGKPMIGIKVAVLDEQGNVLPAGKVGQIAVWRKDNWVRIGDAAHADNEGYFWYKGRLDDVIISAGYTIGAFEVEEVIQKHPAVAKVAVVGVPDIQRGEIVKAFIVLNHHYQPCEKLIQEIQDFVKGRLSKHEYPREIEFVHQLPETPDGKIKRKELREKARNFS